MTVATRTDLSSIVAHFNGVLSTHDGQEFSRKEVWDFSLLQSDRPSESTWIPRTLEDFKALRVKLERIGAMSRALRALSKSFKDELPELKTQVDNAACYWFLQRLPNEILTIILGYAITKLEDATNFSLVSPRFRSIIPSSPRIWAGITLDGKMTSRQMSTVADRSRGLLLKANMTGLHVSIHSVNRTLTHANALGELVVGDHKSDYQEKLERLHLPRLRVLSLLQPYLGGINIYKSWTMPQLRCLKANFIPLPMPNTPIVLCILNLGLQSTRDEGGLLDFLASVPSLEELQLLVHNWPGARTKAVVLPNLRSMTLEHCRTRFPDEQSFLDTLSLKSLSVLIITCEIPFTFAEYSDSSMEQPKVDSGYLCDEVFLLRFIAKQRSLRRLEISFRSSTPLFPGLSVTLLLTHFVGRFIDLQSSVPQLNARLYAGGMPDITWDAVQKRCTEAPLLSLRINNSEYLTVGDLRTALRGALSKYSVQKVDIAGCPNIDEDRLRVLFRDAEVVEYRDTPYARIIL